MEFVKEITYKDIDYSGKNLRNILEKNKVVLVKDYDHNEAPEAFFDQFSADIGRIINMDEDNMTGKPTGERWIEIAYDPEIPNRYRTAPVAQPLHTDYSYIDVNDNIQFFYCRSQAKFGGATTFIDSRFLVELMEISGETELMNDLINTTIHFEKGGRERIKPILSKDGNDWRFNWNYFCVSKQDTHNDLVNRFHEFLEIRVVRSGLVTELTLKKNDVVFFNDELVLHGRNSYFATEKGQRSLIKGTVMLESRVAKNPHVAELR